MALVIRRLVCKVRGHLWTAPTLHGGNFRTCTRCGELGWEINP